MKTLAEILAENADEIIRQAEAINKLIAESREAGTVWPELDEDMFLVGTLLEVISEYQKVRHFLIVGTRFYVNGTDGDYYFTASLVGDNLSVERYVRRSVVKKVLGEVVTEITTFNDVE
jgi:hypothetical protein